MTENKKNNEISDVAKREEEILKFWEENRIFEKSEEKKAPNGDFVFYDGPPFATGKPHFGNLLAGTIKDAFPRYKTMNGYRVLRKWGWDCHGLPLENIIEKKLNLKTKHDIEELGIGNFNEAARGEVFKYADNWEVIVRRMGRWVHMKDDYKTMDATYTESVWWAFSELSKKGLVSEGYKPMHLCPRCGTTLSNFEVTLGYKDIKDFSVTVKLPLVEEKNTYLLAWTTTPWTLPGNVAAAVNKDEIYVSAELENGDIVVLGKERVEDALKDKPHQIIREFKGKELVGKSYKPPFNYYEKEELENKENAWKIWHADYVSQEDGTGLVHIAPAFGGEDMELAEEHHIPIVHHVNEEGKFVDIVGDMKGLLVKPKDDKENGIDHTDTDVEIIKKLAHSGVLFAKEKIEHSYPHCWRCDTPLLNYASSSWFVTVPDIKEELLKENAKVGWVPGDIRDGRFGKWLEGVRDWAISRSRYWGAPIPVWKTKKGEDVIIGSVDDLKGYIPRSGNKYIGIRHGESTSNEEGIISSIKENNHPLTEKGKKQVEKAAKSLQKRKIDIIVTSPLVRTKETTDILASELKIDSSNIIVDDRIAEINLGELNLKPISAYREFADTYEDRFEKRPKGSGAENLSDVRARIGRAIEELERKYKDKTILFVSHEYSLWMLEAVAEGWDKKQTIKEKSGRDDFVKNAEIIDIDFALLPYNPRYELDLHRPYIDDVKLEKDGEELTRVPYVFDCWFESGSMPYAQHNYKGKALDHFDPKKGKGYPADFIAEGLDQTRGWFYSLIVLGTALFGKSPFKNVVVNGLVQAEDGKKMSKSHQNYTDPMEVIDKYGVDSIRYYMLSSPIVRGEDLHFSDKGVQEVMRKNIGRLGNVLSFYNLYKEEVKHKGHAKSKNPLDVWILARLNETIKEVTDSMEKYELDRATRPVASFIDDLSTWYLRRSRDRFKGSDMKDKELALSTARYSLREISKTTAPFMPFFAEFLYKQICEKDDEESVHLDKWPKAEKVDTKALEEMARLRNVVSEALELRDAANVKVRQPLQKLSIKDKDNQFGDELNELIKDELNVKEVVIDENIEGALKLDLDLTPELVDEGNYREFLRHVQALRKKEKLNPSDEVTLEVRGDASIEVIVKNWTKELSEVAGLEQVKFVEFLSSDELSIGESKFQLNIIK